MRGTKTKVCLGGGDGSPCSKQPAFGFNGQKAEYCSVHKKHGMANLRNRRCEFLDCCKEPYFGYEGHKARFCFTHKEESMVDVRHRRCEKVGCAKQPNYALEGGRARFCAVHRLPGMVDVKHRRCNVANCGKYPYFRMQGQKIRACELHRTEGMDRVSPRSYTMMRSSSFRSDTSTDSLAETSHNDTVMLSQPDFGITAHSLHNVKSQSTSNSPLISSSDFVSDLTSSINIPLGPYIRPNICRRKVMNPFPLMHSNNSMYSNIVCAPDMNIFAHNWLSSNAVMNNDAFANLPIEERSTARFHLNNSTYFSDRTSAVVYAYKKRRVEFCGDTMQFLELLA